MTDPSQSLNATFEGAHGYRPFDADNHYYEALDAFSRHLDPKHKARVFDWAVMGRRTYPVLGGKVFRGVKNATFDPVAFPGILADYFRGNPNNEDPLELLSRHEPIRAEYRDRDARLATMDVHGLDKVWLFPTLGMIYEDALKHDPEAVMLLFTAFNRWLDEDWGFAYQDRIFAAPYFTLVDVDWACAELEWAIERGRPHHRHPPCRGHHRQRAPLPRRTASSTPSGPGSTRPASPWSSTPATPATRRTATPPTASPPTSAASPSPSGCCSSSAPSRTGCRRSSATTSSTASRTCGSPRWRTGPSSCPACSSGCGSSAAR